MKEVSVGDKDYKEVLKRSGKYSTISGGFFVISTLLGSVGYILSVSTLRNSTDVKWTLLLIVTGLFISGIISLGIALLVDYINLDLSPFEVKMPERDGDRPETEPVDDPD